MRYADVVSVGRLRALGRAEKRPHRLDETIFSLVMDAEDLILTLTHLSYRDIQGANTFAPARGYCGFTFTANTKHHPHVTKYLGSRGLWGYHSATPCIYFEMVFLVRCRPDIDLNW